MWSPIRWVVDVPPRRQGWKPLPFETKGEGFSFTEVKK